MENLPVLNAKDEVVGSAYIDRQNSQLIVGIKTDQAEGKIKVALSNVQLHENLTDNSLPDRFFKIHNLINNCTT
jgi:hypothetical protein